MKIQIKVNGTKYLINELKTLEFGKEYDIISKKCDDLNLDLIITPFDKESVDFIMNYNIKAIKMHHVI